MEKKRPLLVTSEESTRLPLLIVDKKGFVGIALAKKLREQFLIALVSPNLIGIKGHEIESHKNIIHIPYRRKVPVIPDNTYSHIFVIYNGETEILDMLPMLVKKAQETGAKLFFIAALHSSSKELFKRLNNHAYHYMQILVYGEIFDEETVSENMVNFFIYQARKDGRLEIPNEGMGKLYPVLLDDLLTAIIALAFAQDVKSRIMLAFPKYPYTEISVARAMQKINPDLKIDFSRKKTSVMNYHIPSEGEHIFHAYSLDVRLKSINISKRSDEHAEAKVNLPKKKINYNFRMLFKILLVSILLPLFIILITGLSGAGALSLSVRQAEAGDFKIAGMYANFARNSLSTASWISSSYILFALVPGPQKEAMDKGLALGAQVAEAESNIFASINTILNVSQGHSRNPQKDFQEALGTLKNTLLSLQKIKAENQLPANLNAKLERMSYMTALLENTIDTLPVVLGFTGKKTYLVIFQNNMELRPGGGFIGSYGLLEVDRGKVAKFEINDVYDADGKLKVHIEPPYGLRRYLGASNLFLRDSNFDIDAIANAAAAADLFKRETGVSVDGVISLDTELIKQVIGVLGTVHVEDYDEDVTAENFYLLTQTHAEKDFFPGSTQKKDFLRSLQKSILSEFSTRDDLSYSALVKQLGDSIRQKHLFVVFQDPAIQKVMTVNSLSGGFWDIRTKKENSYLDFFGVVDANVGANKTNYYLKRSIAHTIDLQSNGAVEETAAITYVNTSSRDSAFGGDYKNYIRFILPERANLTSVTIDDREVPAISAITDPAVFTSPIFTPPQGLEIETTERGEKTILGFYFVVPTTSSRKVEISYTVPQAIDTQASGFSYNLRLFKQPGTDKDPYSLSLSYPNEFKPGVDKNFTDLGGKLIYETALSTDRDINIDFFKK